MPVKRIKATLKRISLLRNVKLLWAVAELKNLFSLDFFGAFFCQDKCWQPLGVVRVPAVSRVGAAFWQVRDGFGLAFFLLK